MSDYIESERILGAKLICNFCNPPATLEFNDGFIHICPGCGTEYWVQVSVSKYPSDEVMDFAVMNPIKPVNMNVLEPKCENKE